MKTRNYFFAALIGLLVSFSTSAQDVKVVSMPKYLASCLYSFSRYVNWPFDYKVGDFVIAVVGDKSVFNELQTMVAGKTVGIQNMVVKYYKSTDEISGYHHIVYLSDDQSSNLAKLVTKTGGKGMLMVTEREGMLKSGAAIDFTSVDGLMKFEMSKGNFDKYGLQVSSFLEKMAYKSN
jgi:hypothetical protein